MGRVIRISPNNITEGSSLTSKLENRIVVNKDNYKETLGVEINSNKEYFLDGIIDVSDIQIIVPEGGIEIKGYSFDTSGLVSNSSNHTMFKSKVGGSGNVLFTDFYIDSSGANSKVYDLVALSGFEAIECNRVNYNNCSSLGKIDNYRQGLELGTGRFGGTPELELIGTWIGGFRVTTSITRSLVASSYSLFKAGLGFSMSSRFLTDMNVDLPSGVSFCDFSASNFPNPNTLVVQGGVFTIGGVSDAETNTALLLPNIDQTELPSYWKNNIGIDNTYVGGTMQVLSQNTTVINTLGVYETVTALTWLTTGLEHFDSPSDGQLRHLAGSPREFEITGSFVVEGSANDELSIQFAKWDDSSSTTTDLAYTIQTRKVDNLIGGRDVAYFSVSLGVTLDKNDYIFLKIANQSGTNNVILENDSYFRVQER